MNGGTRVALVPAGAGALRARRPEAHAKRRAGAASRQAVAGQQLAVLREQLAAGRPAATRAVHRQGLR